MSWVPKWRRLHSSATTETKTAPPNHPGADVLFYLQSRLYAEDARSSYERSGIHARGESVAWGGLANERTRALQSKHSTRGPRPPLPLERRPPWGNDEIAKCVFLAYGRRYSSIRPAMAEDWRGKGQHLANKTSWSLSSLELVVYQGRVDLAIPSCMPT